MTKFDLESTINSICNMQIPKNVKKIDFKTKMIIGCMPQKITPVQPDDQSPCILENCKSCDELMWVSERKRKLRDSRSNAEMYCFVWIVTSAGLQRLKPEALDMEKLQ